MHTSAKHAEKALLAKVPANEISEFALPPPTIAASKKETREREEEEEEGRREKPALLHKM